MTVKIIFFLATMTLLAEGLPLNNPPELLTYSSSRSANRYDFSYSTSDQTREEHGVLIPPPRQGVDDEESTFEVHGSYSFIGDDDRFYTVNYVAGINGYKATISISPTRLPEEDVAFLDPNALKSLVG